MSEHRTFAQAIWDLYASIKYSLTFFLKDFFVGSCLRFSGNAFHSLTAKTKNEDDAIGPLYLILVGIMFLGLLAIDLVERFEFSINENRF